MPGRKLVFPVTVGDEIESGVEKVAVRHGISTALRNCRRNQRLGE
jgi:hypothetical protein